MYLTCYNNYIILYLECLDVSISFKASQGNFFIYFEILNACVS